MTHVTYPWTADSGNRPTGRRQRRRFGRVARNLIVGFAASAILASCNPGGMPSNTNYPGPGRANTGVATVDGN